MMTKEQAVIRAQQAANRWRRRYAVVQVFAGARAGAWAYSYYKVTPDRDDFPQEWALVALADPDVKGVRHDH